MFVCIFFCTYSTSIHISRRLYFSFLSLRLFFPMVGCPTILSLWFRSLSLFFLHYYQHRESIKEFVCFPFVFGPNFFLLLFFPLFYLSTLARIDVFADAKSAHTYRKKKTEDEEDEHTYTIEKKECCCRWTRFFSSFHFFFNLRSVTTIYIYERSRIEHFGSKQKKKVRLVLFFSLSLFLLHTYFFLSFISVWRKKGSSTRLNLCYQIFFLLLCEEDIVAKVGNDIIKKKSSILISFSCERMSRNIFGSSREKKKKKY